MDKIALIETVLTSLILTVFVVVKETWLYRHQEYYLEIMYRKVLACLSFRANFPETKAELEDAKLELALKVEGAWVVFCPQSASKGKRVYVMSPDFSECMATAYSHYQENIWFHGAPEGYWDDRDEKKFKRRSGRDLRRLYRGLQFRNRSLSRMGFRPLAEVKATVVREEE